MSNVDYPQHCQAVAHTNNNSDLIRRLKSLSESLQIADRNEEVGDKTRFASLAAHLTNEKFLNTNSRDVQIWLACCIADLFRIFSPEMPITGSEHLRETLLFLVRALKGLANPSNPLFKRYFYLLENVSATNCISLCLDLPPNDSSVVIRQFLKSSLEAASGKEWSQPSRELSVELNGVEDSRANDAEDKDERKEKMYSLLVGIALMLLSEVDHISDSILDVLFLYLINPQKTNYKGSFILARSMVLQTFSSLERPIEVLLTRSLLSGGLPNTCPLVGSTLPKLHDVIIELHDISPDLIAPVITQLGTFLRSEDQHERELTTQTMGNLLRSKKCNICEDHPSVWDCYLERFKDKVPEIRAICAKHCSRILVNHSHLRGPLCDALCRLLCDTVDTVRTAALTASIDAASIKLESVNEQLVAKCCDRLKDKKLSIRIEALCKLMKLHSKVVMGEAYTDSDKQVVAVIPEQTLLLYHHPSLKDERYYLERFVQVNIVPFRMCTPKRILWMCNLYCRLSGAATNAFYMIIRQNSAYRRLVKEILLLISNASSDEEKSSHIESRIQKISSSQPNPSQSLLMLKSFTNLLSTKQMAFDLVKDLVSYEYTVDDCVEKGVSLIQAVAASGFFNKETENSCRHFVERFSLLLLDTLSASSLLKHILHEQADMDCGKIGSEERVSKLMKMLRSWSESYPLLFSSDDSINLLLKYLDSDNYVSVEGALEVLRNLCIQGSFKCTGKVWYNNLCSAVRGLITTKQKSFGRVAKLSVYLLCLICPKESLTGTDGEFVATTKELLARVSIEDPDTSVNALRALGAISKATHEDVLELLEVAATDILAPLILSDCTHESDSQNVDLIQPLKKQPLPIYTNIKVYALKLLSRFLNGSVHLDALASKIFKLLLSIVDSEGQLHDSSVLISPIEKAILRAVAGSCLLKICSNSRYVSVLGANGIVTLSKLVFDDVEFVRSYFIIHLTKGLMRNRLSIEFASLFACVFLLKPEGELTEARIKSFRDNQKQILTTFIQQRLSFLESAKCSTETLPYYQPEYVIAYGIFVLSSQPFFSSSDDVDVLAYLQECLWYLMEPFLGKTAFDKELIWKSLETVKASVNAVLACQRKEGLVNDEQFYEENKKMWALADLAMVMISYRAKVSVNSGTKKAALSKRFFEQMKSSKIKVHAPEELIEDEKKRNGKLPTSKSKLFGLRGLKTRKNPSTRETGVYTLVEYPNTEDGVLPSTSTDDKEPGDIDNVVQKQDNSASVQTRKRRSSRTMKTSEKEANGKKKEDEFSDLTVSPIVKDSVVRKNLAKGRGAKSSGLTSSTPIRRPVSIKRKNPEQLEPNEEIETESDDSEFSEATENKSNSSRKAKKKRAANGVTTRSRRGKKR